MGPSDHARPGEQNMGGGETVFETTYRNYLQQLSAISPAAVAAKIGAAIDGNVLRIPVFNSEYRVSAEGITADSGERPAFDICVILSKYVLLCPARTPENSGWVSFRNFKDAGPLTNYFQNDVERNIASHFAGRIDDLKIAANSLGGYLPKLEVNYDFSVQLDALPKIPLVVLYNDADEEFPPSASVLFESRAEAYLDAECLAMLGWQLFYRLRKAWQGRGR